MKRKRLLALGLSITMLLSACQTSKPDTSGNKQDATAPTASEAAPSSSDEKVTINLWHQWTNETDPMKAGAAKAAQDYMAQHPNVDIKINMLENEAYKTKISTEFAGKAPEIDTFFYFGAGRGKQLADADKLLDISSYVSKEDLALIQDGALNNFTYSDKLYGLPLYSKQTVLYVNKELADQVGAKVPTNYDELVDTVKKFKDAGIQPISVGAKEGWQAAYIVDMLSLRNVGAEKLNKILSGETPYEDEGFKDAAQKTIDLFNLGAFGENPLEVSSQDADTLFLTGKAGMRVTGSWMADSVYTSKDSVVQDKVVAVPIPMINGGNSIESDFYGGFVDTFFINKNVANPEVVVDFDVFLTKALAKIRVESGQGTGAWKIETDDSNINAVAKEISAFAKTQVEGVLSWDNVIDSNTATTHSEAAQELFSPGATAQGYFDKNKEAFENR